MNSDRPHLLFRPESVSRSLSVYIPATAIARGLGLVRGVILARLISEHEFGLFQVTLLVVNVLNPLCGLGLNEGVARYVPMYESRGLLRSYLGRAVPFVAGVALLLSSVVFLAAQPLGKVIYETLPQAGAVVGGRGVSPETWTALTRITAGVTFGTVLFFLLLAALKGMRMFRAVSLLELLNNLLFTGLTIAAALAGWETAGAMMGCYGLTLLVVLPLFAIPMFRTVRDEPRTGPNGPLEEPPLPADDGEIIEQQMLTSVRRQITPEPAVAAGEASTPSVSGFSPLDQLVRFSMWAAVAAVVWQVLQYYPMWFLQKTHGPAVTAVFGGVRLITQVVAVGAVTVIAVIQTSVNKLWESQGHDEADRRLLLAYKSTSLLMLIGCVLLALAAEPVMRLFPASYAIGVPIFPLSLLFFLVSSHLTFLAIHFALIEKMRHLFWPWMLGLLCNVLFGILLVSPQAPAQEALLGAAWAGNLGITAALLAAVALMWMEHRPIDVGMVVFWLAIYVLALPPLVQVVLMGLIVAVTVGTSWLFTARDKSDVIAHVREVWRHVSARMGMGSEKTGGRP